MREEWRILLSNHRAPLVVVDLQLSATHKGGHLHGVQPHGMHVCVHLAPMTVSHMPRVPPPCPRSAHPVLFLKSAIRASRVRRSMAVAVAVVMAVSMSVRVRVPIRIAEKLLGLRPA